MSAGSSGAHSVTGSAGTVASACTAAAKLRQCLNADGASPTTMPVMREPACALARSPGAALVRDYEAAACVLEAVGEFVGSATAVGEHRNGAECGDRNERDQPLRSIAHRDGDVGAALDTALGQMRRQHRGLGEDLPVGKAHPLHHRQLAPIMRARGHVQLREEPRRVAEYLTRLPAHDRFHQLKRLARRGKGGDAVRGETAVTGTHCRRF